MGTAHDRAIADFAAAHHGRFTAEHARELGFDDHHREYRVRSGRWELRHPGVYRIAGTPDTWHGQVLESCWAVHGIAAASHRSAAVLHDLPGGTRDMVEISCARWHRGFVSGLVVHESTLFRPEDLEEIDGVPVTTIEQTLLGLAAVVSEPVVEMALDRALLRELTTRPRFHAFLDVKGARGRNGIGVLRALIEAHDPLVGLPESVMETKLKQVLRRHGLPTPVFQHVIRHEGQFVARVDAAYPELRIAIEYDSYEHHMGKVALVRDARRRNRLLRLGWQTITFTAADLANDGGHAIDALIAARHIATAF